MLPIIANPTVRQLLQTVSKGQLPEEVPGMLPGNKHGDLREAVRTVTGNICRFPGLKIETWGTHSSLP